MIPEAVLDELRRRADLVTYVSRHVQLVRSGQAWRGLCPFHQEATPSLSVRAEPPTFRCFGCGARGDIFAFAMRREHFSFRDAVEHVAETLGLSLRLNERRNEQAARGNDELLEALRAAAAHFQATLWSRRGDLAREYLARRGLTRPTLERIGAGASTDASDDLVSALAPRLGLRLLRSAGLIHQVPGRPHADRFRSRVILPIHADRERLVGFGARSIDNSPPKYLNSPTSELYQKSRQLYGLPWASEAARAGGRVVLVEGYLDAAAALQAGVPETLAVCGTAVTGHHARLLRQIASRVILCLDQDPAGIQAARRALLTLLDTSLDVRVATLPAGHDPDSYIQAAGSESFRRVLDNSTPAMEWLINWSADLHDTTSPSGKAAFLGALVPYLTRVQGPVERAAWLQLAARQGALDEGAAREQLVRAMDHRPRRSGSREVTEFAWASRYGDHGTLLLDGLEQQGWTRVAAHPWYSDLWLLQRLATDACRPQRQFGSAKS